MSDMSEDLMRYIEERVEKTDGCWLWTKAKTRAGYGHFKWGDRWLRCSRAVLHCSLGLSLDGDWVARHTCDNTACCNPDHLLAGTQKNNVEDMHARGRAARGTSTGVLTEDQVRQIRARVASGERSYAVAEDYPVSYEQVRRIVRRRTWAWLA